MAFKVCGVTDPAKVAGVATPAKVGGVTASSGPIVRTDDFSGNLDAWAVFTGSTTLTITGGQVTGTDSADCVMYRNDVDFPADQYSQAQYIAGAFTGVNVRLSKTDDIGFMADVAYDNQQITYKQNLGAGGGWEAIGSAINVDIAVNDYIRLEVVGSSPPVLTCYTKRGAGSFTSIGTTANGNTGITSGQPGIKCYTTAAIFDNWEGGDL